MTVTVDNGKVKIDGYENHDPEVVAYFEYLAQHTKNLEGELDKLLKLGALAAKAGNVGLSTDYVEKAVAELKNNFQQQFDNVFGNNGTLPQIMAENFGEDGTLMTELLNPEKDGSPTNVLKKHMDESFQKLITETGIASAIKQQMKTDPKKGAEFEKYCEELLQEIAKPHGDIVEDKHNEIGNVAGSKKGDYVYTVTALSKKIVLDMKEYTSKLPSCRKCLDMLDIAMQNRDAEYGILVSKRKSALPSEVGMFQEYEDNKLILALTADDSEDALTENAFLEIAVKLAKRRLREQTGSINPTTIFDKIKEVERQIKRFQGLKAKCSSINTTSDAIKHDLGEIETEIQESLTKISDSFTAGITQSST